jgi:YggT family protein
MFLGQIVEPVLRPVRRVLPHIGGLDISPMIVMVLLYALSIFIRELIPLVL